MNEQERQELEADQAAREDCLYETYGRETDLCAQVDRDHEEHLYEVWLNSLTPEERTEHDAKLAVQRAELEDYKNSMTHWPDDAPF